MLSLFAIALLLRAPQTPPPPDESFSARVLRGKLVEAGVAGLAYQKQMWERINDPVTALLKACIDSNAPADKSPFTVVANLSSDGKPGRIEAQPATPVASCFASGFATIELPPPPRLPDSAVYPIEIDVSIVP
jgi:hypothetical protein